MLYEIRFPSGETIMVRGLIPLCIALERYEKQGLKVTYRMIAED